MKREVVEKQRMEDYRSGVAARVRRSRGEMTAATRRVGRLANTLLQLAAIDKEDAATLSDLVPSLARLMSIAAKEQASYLAGVELLELDDQALLRRWQATAEVHS